VLISINSDTYQPAPAKPVGFDDEVTAVKGRNPLGQPQWRVVWGMDQFIDRGGKRFPKYGGMTVSGLGPACWVLEGWFPAEFFGDKKLWEEKRYAQTDDGLEDILGEYPRNGEYGSIYPIIRKRGNELYFVPLSQEVLDFIYLIRHNQTLVPNREAVLGQIQLEAERRRATETQDASAKADELQDWVNTKGWMTNRDSARGKGISRILSMDEFAGRQTKVTPGGIITLGDC